MFEQQTIAIILPLYRDLENLPILLCHIQYFKPEGKHGQTSFGLSTMPRHQMPGQRILAKVKYLTYGARDTTKHSNTLRNYICCSPNLSRMQLMLEV